ncbi:hypothetical protein IW15_18020 [Chryseobacterium soli]|uniref:Uncharacterized protein n=1 Tax=Chryseobacterium soli TaxID=445961 RepID=A0A086A2Z1_9FLAO|nr:hypothetical protein [Chryseobacterium soli]KFF11055.1 hypothetical protein IW15_18020 [Chryseobacterium soli]
MKKRVTLFLAILFASTIFAQEKKIDFANKFTYQSITKKYNDNKQFILALEVFANNSEGLLITNPRFADSYNSSQSFFYDDSGFSWVSFGINNRLTYNPQYEMSFDIDKETKPNYEVTNLNVKEKVGEYNCTQYSLKYRNRNFTDADSVENPDDSHSTLKVCIDDGNTTNNSNLLFIMTNYYGVNANSKNIFPKGLVVKIGDEKDYDTEYTMLIKSEKIAQTVYFDRKKEIQKETKFRDSLKLAEEKYNADKGIAEATKAASEAARSTVADAAKSAEDATNEVSTAENDLPKYESTYKKENSSESNLAMDEDISGNQKNALPKYCFRIKDDLPKFGNQEVAKHLKNYAGQVCDMYLTQGENSLVYVKGTIDEIRQEVLYLFTIREKLDQSDRKKLDDYLNNLD